MSAGLHTVHVRVNDAATGQPTPVRLRIVDAEENYYAPFGRLVDFATGEDEDVGGNLLLRAKKYAYIDGSCEINLPAGGIQVELHKGPEYIPQQVHSKLGAGQLALRYSVKRWTNLRQEGWYSGDAGAFSLTPHAALLEAAAEDLAVVNLLSEVSTRRVLPNVLAFSGQRPALERSGHLVVVNTRNHHAMLGSLSLLHCHRLIFPLEVAEEQPLGQWTLADWCDQCHRKGGLVVWNSDVNSYKLKGHTYGEGLAELLLGKIDAIELNAAQNASEFLNEHWYPFLNSGCRVPLVGSSHKRSNRRLLGSLRTYARLAAGDELTYKSWVEAIRAGRTFVTNGPLLRFTVNGHDPGEVVELPSLDQPLHIVAEARSNAPFAGLELLLNGDVLARADASGSPPTASLTTELKVPSAGWLAIRCRGTQRVAIGDSDQEAMAHSSPVYVQITDRQAHADRATIVKLSEHLDRWLTFIAERCGHETAQPAQRLARIFENARQVLHERLQRASRT